MSAYKIMWDSLKETAEVMVETGKTLKVEDGVNAVLWSTLLDMMEEEIDYELEGIENENA